MAFEDLAVGPDPQLPLETFERRRARVAETLADDQVLVVATHQETPYSNDVENRFRPHSDFWYLTGFAEPGCVLAIAADGRTDLWMRARQPEAEVWTGRRLGLERAGDLGIERAHDSKDLAGLARSVGTRTVLAQTAHHGLAQAALHGLAVEEARPLLGRMRMIKEPEEVRMLQQAADVGCHAMERALPLARPGRREHEVEAELLRTYRAAGSTGPGYPPIVGSGANAAILHYVENKRTIQDGDLVLVDAGCEWGYYNSDITRTVPASGEFSRVQGDLYETVWRAHQAAIRQVRPGRPFKAPHEAAVGVLIDGLVDLGYLKGDKDDLLARQAHRAYYMHGTSHFLGLDVHDVGSYKDDRGQSPVLEEGMCLTVEPGLYFNQDFATCPAAAAGIGIRIEDDVVVTDEGCRDLVHLGSAPAEALSLLA